MHRFIENLKHDPLIPATHRQSILFEVQRLGWQVSVHDERRRILNNALKMLGISRGGRRMGIL